MQGLYHLVCIQYPILRYNIIKLAIIRVSTIPVSKKSLKVATINTAKRVRVEQEKSISPEFVLFSQNESDSNIFILTPA